MKQKADRVLLLVFFVMIISTSTSCGFGDEGQIRDVIYQTFEAAQKGDIARALEFLDPEHPVLLMAEGMKRNDAKKFDETLADLGKRSIKLLKNRRLTISRIDIQGDLATAQCLVTQEQRKDVEVTIKLRKRSQMWKLSTIPTIE